MASTAQAQGQQSSTDEKPFAFGYMLLPGAEQNAEDAAAQEREFQNEINSLNSLFAADPYAGMPPGTTMPFANSQAQDHQFTFTPPTVHGVDAVYFEQQQRQQQHQPPHISSMNAPYMGMHQPAFEFIGFNPENPYTPTGEVTNSFAGLNMATGAMRGGIPAPHILNGLDTSGGAEHPPPAQSALRSPLITKPPPFDDDTTSPTTVNPNHDQFFLPFPPDPPRRGSNAPAAVSSLLRFPHFGSDPSFTGRFNRSNDAASYEDANDKRDRITRFALHPSKSEENTPPTSPKFRRPSALLSSLNREPSPESEQSSPHEQAAASKRRRIGSSQDVSTSDDDREDSQVRGDEHSPSRNRRKSSTAGNVANARRNLTEEQRRQNHNRSEQRRRTVITDDLTLVRNLVPALINTTASKAIAIRETYQFLNELIEGNKELEQMLGPEIARAGPYPSADFTRPGQGANLGNQG